MASAFTVLLTGASVSAGPVFTFEQHLVSNQGSAGDQLGSSVSVDGTTALVGAAFDDRDGVPDLGSVEVRVRVDSAWVEQATLLPSDPSASKSFGLSVDIDGDRALVGAVGDATNGLGGGAAYVFERSGQRWQEVTKLVPGDGGTNAIAGWSVALQGDVAVVGAPLHDVPATDAGAVYIFEFAGGAWTQVQKLQAELPDMEDRFGVSVAIDGNTIVVGSLGDDDLGASAGAAYVYVNDTGSWVLQEKLLAPDGEAHDYGGISVDVSGERVIVGARKDDDNGIDAGAAYVFLRTGTAWSLEQKLLASDGKALDDFGYAVSISGDFAFVGAFFSDHLGDQSGSAYAYLHGGAGWTEVEKVVPASLGPGDEFGGAVAASENLAIAGARFQSSDDRGGAYVYETLPRCTLEMDERTYFDGEVVMMDSFRLRISSRDDDLAVEWKTWLTRPGEAPTSLISYGANGLLVLSSGMDYENGPLPVMSVTPAEPRGRYTVGCHFLVPATGESHSLETTSFEVQ